MFAVIITGRLVQTDVVAVDERKFLFNLLNMDNVNHIVVFMTGQQPFPEGLGGSVYINWPTEQNQNSWQLIGHLTNEKPSAIFKISGLQKSELPNSNVFANMSNFGPTHPNHAQLGISLESLSEISQQVPSIASTTNEQGSTFMEFSNSMLTNFYNYSSSFSKSLDEIVKIASSSYDQSVAKTQFIPSDVLENWMKQFQAKLARDINFWKK